MTYYVAFSGGADSTALAILLHEQGVDYELVFSDTGAELPETYWMIPRVASALGKKLTVTHNGSFFQWLNEFGFLLPSIHRRWCTRLLKVSPQDRYMGDVKPAVGIRADEAHRMEGALRPLVDAGMDKKDVIALCEKYDLLNPCYEWRSSCSCFCCPFQRIGDWKGLQKTHPDLFGLAEEWERLQMEISPTGFGWLSSKKKLKDLREAQEDQLELFSEPTETACAICQW